MADGEELIAWATSLEDGSPLQDVQVKLVPGGKAGQTDSDGIVRIGLDSEQNARANLLAAAHGEDCAILPKSCNHEHAWSTPWARQPDKVRLLWYVIDDRGIYRPGEEVHVKGWIRALSAGKAGDVGLIPRARVVRYNVLDQNRNDMAMKLVQVWRRICMYSALRR